MDIAVIITVIGAIIVAVLGFIFEKERDRKAKLHERKEESYKNLLFSLKGFFHGRHDSAMKEKFVDETRLTRLYASDKSIKALNQLLDTMAKDETTFGVSSIPNYQDTIHELLGKFVKAMREDLGIKTGLSPKELGRTEYVNKT